MSDEKVDYSVAIMVAAICGLLASAPIAAAIAEVGVAFAEAQNSCKCEEVKRE